MISIVLSPIYKLFENVYSKTWLLDGLEGFSLATTSSQFYTMVKYYKLREIYKINPILKRKETMEIKRILVSRTG